MELKFKDKKKERKRKMAPQEAVENPSTKLQKGN